MKHALRCFNVLIKSFVIFISLVSFLLVVFFLFLAKRHPDYLINVVNQIKPTPTPVFLQIKGIGVLGDSQSDEYRADDNRGANYPETTLNWVELLARYRNLNFGKWQYWEEPRRAGYEYNWARTGATTESLLASGQHTGVAEQVRQGKVNFVIIYIGANDFAPYITSTGYQAIYNDSLTDAEILEKENRIAADITTAIDTIKKAGSVQILLVKIPDWGRNIAVQVAFPDPVQRNKVTDVITKTNEKLQKVADERNIRTLDPNVFYDTLLRENDNSSVRVGNVVLQTLLLNNDPHNAFLEDGTHLGTVMNGLFANYLLTSINTYFGTNTKPFTDKELLKNAGINQ